MVLGRKDTTTDWLAEHYSCLKFYGEGDEVFSLPFSVVMFENWHSGLPEHTLFLNLECCWISHWYVQNITHLHWRLSSVFTEVEKEA